MVKDWQKEDLQYFDDKLATLKSRNAPDAIIEKVQNQRNLLAEVLRIECKL